MRRGMEYHYNNGERQTWLIGTYLRYIKTFKKKKNTFFSFFN